MEDIKTYEWMVFEEPNKLPKDKCKTILLSDPFLDIPYIKQNIPELFSLFENFLMHFNAFTISIETITHIDNLLLANSILNRNKEFYLISAVFQYAFNSEKADLLHFEDKGWQKIIETASSQKELFFELLKDKINKKPSGISSISFTTDTAKTINNLLIVDDILNALVGYYGFTSENFEFRKSELLTNYHKDKIGKTDIQLKLKLMKSLNRMICTLNRLEPSSNEALKFTGSFFLASQIPLTSRKPIVETDIDTALLMSEGAIKYLNGFLK